MQTYTIKGTREIKQVFELNVFARNEREALEVSGNLLRNTDNTATFVDAGSSLKIREVNGEAVDAGDVNRRINLPKSFDYTPEQEMFIQERRHQGQYINPENAEVKAFYGIMFDPYGLGLSVHPECCVSEKHNFARNPGDEHWVCFNDIPREILEKIEQRLAVGSADVRTHSDCEMPW